MKSARERYGPYLRELRESHPEHVPLLRAAIDAYDSIQDGKRPTQQLLQPIVEAASDSRRLLYDIPVDFFQHLTGRHKEAREAVWKMAEDPRSQTRFAAIICIGKSAPRAFKIRLLRQGLRDKSSRVRWKAADWAGRHRIKELVPDLEEAVAVERDAKARSTIEFGLKLLRDGYILEPESDDVLKVTAFTCDGFGSRWVQRSELESRGIQSIVSEMASH